MRLGIHMTLHIQGNHHQILNSFLPFCDLYVLLTNSSDKLIKKTYVGLKLGHSGKNGQLFTIIYYEENLDFVKLKMAD